MADQGVSRRQTLPMAAMAAGGLTGCLGYLPVDKGVSDDDGATTIHVKPEGSPLNSGAPDDALTSTDRATDFADPGDTVYVHPGEYTELVDLTTGGSPGEPFTLTGPPDAVLRPPEGKDQLALDIKESYTYLTGLTITGLHDPAATEDPDSYHPGKLILIDRDQTTPTSISKASSCHHTSSAARGSRSSTVSSSRTPRLAGSRSSTRPARTGFSAIRRVTAVRSSTAAPLRTIGWTVGSNITTALETSESITSTTARGICTPSSSAAKPGIVTST